MVQTSVYVDMDGRDICLGHLDAEERKLLARVQYAISPFGCVSTQAFDFVDGLTVDRKSVGGLSQLQFTRKRYLLIEGHVGKWRKLHPGDLNPSAISSVSIVP